MCKGENCCRSSSFKSDISTTNRLPDGFYNNGKAVACCTASDKSPASPESHKTGSRVLQGGIPTSMATLSILPCNLPFTTRWRRTAICRARRVHFTGCKLLSWIHTGLCRSTRPATLPTPRKSVLGRPWETRSIARHPPQEERHHTNKVSTHNSSLNKQTSWNPFTIIDFYTL